MPDAYALSEETYDRFNRAASRVLSTNPGGGPPRAWPTNDRHVVKVSSSTIGTYGYPAKLQRFDNSTGTYGDDPDRPQTIYLIDPAGGAYTSGQYADAVFAGYRGAANESVYEAVKQGGASATTGTGTLSYSFGVAAGSSPTLLNLAGTAYGGTMYFKSGTAVTTGTIFSITFSGMGTALFRGFVFSPCSQAAAAIPAYTFATTGLGATGFSLYTQTALTATTNYQWNWMCFTNAW
jgi:hypothetical protein